MRAVLLLTVHHRGGGGLWVTKGRRFPATAVSRETCAYRIEPARCSIPTSRSGHGLADRRSGSGFPEYKRNSRRLDGCPSPRPIWPDHSSVPVGFAPCGLCTVWALHRVSFAPSGFCTGLLPQNQLVCDRLSARVFHPVFRRVPSELRGRACSEAAVDRTPQRPSLKSTFHVKPLECPAPSGVGSDLDGSETGCRSWACAR